MMKSPGLTLACATAALLLPVSPSLGKKKKPKIPPCTGRYLVAGARLIGSGTVPGDAVVIAGGMLSLDSGCAPVKAKITTGKRFGQYVAKWRSCDGISGRATFRAKIDTATCSKVSGVFAAKKAHIRRRFTATLQQAPAFT